SPLAEQVVLDAVEGWVETLYAFLNSYITDTVELSDGTIDVIEWNSGESFWEVVQNVGIYSPTDSFAGATDELPNQCSAFVIGNTARPKSKGRMFAFPFDEASQEHGILVGGALAALGQFAGQYVADQAIAGDSLQSGIVRETTSDWLGFITASYGDVIGTQRRRRLGIGA
ncbi:unnamed protein product, partial [marine sediment metagenome]